MALSQHKIPIITGRNDVPTTSESQENHPNGSFTTAKYNDLIDELTPRFGFRQRYVEYYVDGTSGNDTTGDGTDVNPFATIQKAIDTAVLNGYHQDLWLNLSGTFENPSIDLSSYILQSNYMGKLTGIYLYGTNAIFNFSNLVTNATVEFEGDSDFEFIKIKHPQCLIIDIDGIDFNFNDYSTGLFFDNKLVIIKNCSFSSTANSRAYALMSFNSCGLTLKDSVFYDLPMISINSTNINTSPVDLNNCNVLFDNTSFIGLSNASLKALNARNNQILIRSDNATLNGQLITISGVGNRIEFLNINPEQIVELMSYFDVDVLIQNKIVGA